MSALSHSSTKQHLLWACGKLTPGQHYPQIVPSNQFVNPLVANTLRNTLSLIAITSSTPGNLDTCEAQPFQYDTPASMPPSHISLPFEDAQHSPSEATQCKHRHPNCNPFNLASIASEATTKSFVNIRDTLGKRTGANTARFPPLTAGYQHFGSHNSNTNACVLYDC